MEEQIMQLFDQSERDLQWFQRNLEKLKEKYDGEFIAFKEEMVLAHAKSMEGVMEGIKKQGENPSQVLVQFISKAKMVF